MAAGVVALLLSLLLAAHTLLNGVAGNLMAGVLVPALAVSGGRVNITCNFDLGTTGLYSLKWYHNDTEFYRFVPTEKVWPVDVKPTITFQAHEVSRTEREVTLSLTSLTGDASGEYKCEVIAEHPSFRTETASATMTVLDSALPAPRLIGRNTYEGNEEVRVRCEADPLPLTSPLPTLTWYLAGNQGTRFSPQQASSSCASSPSCG